MSDRPSVECPNCGVVLPEGLETCSHCGTALQKAEDLDITLVPAAAQTAPQPAPPVTPPPVPARPAMPPLDLPADTSVSTTATLAGGIRINRVTSAKVNLKIPQEAVDKQHWLTPEQWERLLQVYSAALAEHMKADMRAGQAFDLFAESGETVLDWAPVGDQLTPAQRSQIEQGLRQILGATNATIEAPTIPGIIVSPPARVRFSAGCLVPTLFASLLIVAATLHTLVH
ncbi:MAG: zinc ribbon domain-containing protein [Armatimonadia bacterium]